MVMNRTIINYTFQIECDSDDAPNPVHLCEEIQAYLNSGYHYDEPFEMVEKAEAAIQPPATEEVQDRPDWLPEKFNTPEDMAKAYSELEQQFHSSREEANEAALENKDAAIDELEAHGIDYSAMSQDFWEKCGLSDEQYDQLEDAGIPSDVVDSFIDGQMALVDQTRQQAYNLVGGEESYKNMMDWAANNLTADEQEVFNRTVDTGNPQDAVFAIQGLHSRYRSGVGVEPNLVKGEVGDTTVGNFQSLAEITAAMSDPRYEKDPAYRSQVAEKLRKSSVL